MLKLIKLEYIKNNIFKYIRNAIVMSVIIMLFLFSFVYLGIANDADTGVPDAVTGATGVTVNVELITGISYMIFATVMHSSFIISAYKNRTMNLMFLYPINRKLIVISQMISVFIFNIFGLIVTKLLVYIMILFGSKFLTPDFEIDFNLLSMNFYVILFLKSIMTISVSLIALFIGLFFKSSKAAIVSSFLLIILMQGNIGGATFANNVFLPIILTIFSGVFAYLSIKNIEIKDI